MSSQERRALWSRARALLGRPNRLAGTIPRARWRDARTVGDGTGLAAPRFHDAYFADNGTDPRVAASVVGSGGLVNAG